MNSLRFKQLLSIDMAEIFSYKKPAYIITKEYRYDKIKYLNCFKHKFSISRKGFIMIMNLL
jgi:hypothetical protein